MPNFEGTMTHLTQCDLDLDQSPC